MGETPRVPVSWVCDAQGIGSQFHAGFQLNSCRRLDRRCGVRTWGLSREISPFFLLIKLSSGVVLLLAMLRCQVEVLEYPELGMEAVWKIEVENFPAFIVVDGKGELVQETPALPGSVFPRVDRFQISSEVQIIVVASTILCYVRFRKGCIVADDNSWQQSVAEMEKLRMRCSGAPQQQRRASLSNRRSCSSHLPCYGQ